MNFLEQLTAEWLEYNGYFVRRNVMVGRRARGGWECELDVVAFNPSTRHLVQVEPSMDAHSWATREQRYRRKFAAGVRHVPALFEGVAKDPTIDQVAVFGLGGRPLRAERFAGGRIVLAKELIAEIAGCLRTRPILGEAVPEQFVCLRSIQFCVQSAGASPAAVPLLAVPPPSTRRRRSA